MRHIAAALLALAACGGRIAASDDSSYDATAPEATDAASYDVELPDGFDAASCIGIVTFDPGCTPQWDEFCQVWTRDRAYGAYGHSVCQDAADMAQGFCSLGDYCPDGEPCRCSPILICAPGQVCYSDTPDGSTHCKAACTPSP